MHNTQLFSQILNGEKLIFHVLENLTQPCSVCGVPACGRENILWYKQNEKHLAIIFDGIILDHALTEFLADKKLIPDNLPEFIQSWIELRGWKDSEDLKGFTLDIPDFIASMELLKKVSHLLDYQNQFTKMIKLAQNAQSIGSPLRIIEG